MKTMGALFVLAGFAVGSAQDAQTNDGAVETYGNFKMEWQTFVTEAPAVSFAPKGNQLWYATSAGVGVIDLETGKTQAHRKLGEISSSGVHSVCIDDDGKVWIGSNNGIAVHDGQKFTNYTTESGLPHIVVNVLVSTATSLWAGTEKGAAEYKGGKWTAYGIAEGLAGENVRDIVVDGSGTLWFGTDKGISAFDGVTWTTHDMNSGLSWNDTKALGYDPRKEMVWAAVGDADVNAYDGKEWRTFMTVQEGITSIMVDTQSRVWFGYPEGVFKYNGFEWVFDNQKIGFPATQVREMHRDEDGNLWFAMGTGVLKLKNPYPF